MKPNFEKFTQKGQAFINEVAVELGIPDEKGTAYRILRSVLHALRNKIPPQESLQLVAQLPMFIKAVYVDGWQLTKKGNKIRHLDDFLQAVKNEDGTTGEYDFRTSLEIEEAVKCVFTVLKRHVSEGEINDVIKTLPMEIRPLMV